MGIIVFAVCLAASVIGGICGIGGGVIIKPVLDAMGVMSVSALQFLSGLTVLGMSAVSVLRRRGEHLLELRTGNALATGAVLGGLAGNMLFQLLRHAVADDRTVGAAQAVLLGLLPLLTLLYSACYAVKALLACYLGELSVHHSLLPERQLSHHPDQRNGAGFFMVPAADDGSRRRAGRTDRLADQQKDIRRCGGPTVLWPAPGDRGHLCV